MNSDAEILKAISKAKASLVIEQPFIASIICSLPLRLDDTLNPPTLATNGQEVRLHPDWVRAHSGRELSWALAHETFHCVFKHMLNRKLRDPALWNIAGDVVINQLLETDNVGIRPKGVIWEPKLYVDGGKTTEGVYNLLQQQSKGGCGAGQWDSCDPMDGDASAQASADADWSVKIASAAAAAKMCGKLSADLERLVGEALRAKVSWKDQLRHFFTKRARVEHTFARPNRRFLSQGLYMPGKSGNTLGDVLIGFDLSGSVSPAEMQEFVAELRNIKEDCKPTGVHVCYFAGEVTSYEHFGFDDELDLHPRGTGGTAFRPVFEYADEHGFEIDACVMLTDLYSSDFGPAPEYPVMWASTGATVAPFGEVIELRANRAN